MMREKVHRCHAAGCDTPCAPTLLMCGKHWSRVPVPLKREVWKHYRQGQERTEAVTPEYLAAARAAVAAVSEMEEEGR